MEVGVRGENGAPALNRVALDHSTAPGRAPGLFHRTEVNSVLGRTKRRGTATLIIVLWMVGGLTGVIGAHARELVEMESSTASDTVTIPHPSTEARNVTEQTSKHESAK